MLHIPCTHEALGPIEVSDDTATIILLIADSLLFGLCRLLLLASEMSNLLRIEDVVVPQLTIMGCPDQPQHPKSCSSLKPAGHPTAAPQPEQSLLARTLWIHFIDYLLLYLDIRWLSAQAINFHPNPST